MRFLFCQQPAVERVLCQPPDARAVILRLLSHDTARTGSNGGAVSGVCWQGAKRNMMPSLSQPDKLETFFNAVATLMSMNVQNLLLHTIWEYTDMLCSSKVGVQLNRRTVLPCERPLVRDIVRTYYCIIETVRVYRGRSFF